MKNLPTILILALAFIHGVNAGKIGGTMDSREDGSMLPMPGDGPLEEGERELESGAGQMSIPIDQADGPMNFELIAMNSSSSKYLEAENTDY